VPLQNRVTPLGDIVAVAGRGRWLGNRGGCLHDEHRQLHPRRRWVNQHWLICRLEFKQRRRTLMTPRRYTELFFLDEPTAFAAGHRPCAECRRDAFNRFADQWAETFPPASVPRSGHRVKVAEIDARLHAERLAVAVRRARQPASLEQVIAETCISRRLGDLPAGAMVLQRGEPWACRGSAGHGKVTLLRWTPDGYDTAETLGEPEQLQVVTPPAIVSLLRAGYGPIDWHLGAENF